MSFEGNVKFRGQYLICFNTLPLTFTTHFCRAKEEKKAIDDHGVFVGDVNKHDLIGLHDFINNLI